MVEMPVQPSMSLYSRQDVERILHLGPRQIAVWERAGLLPVAGPEARYSFSDLRQMRTLRDLQGNRVSVEKISRSVSAMRRVAGMSNPLLEAGTVRRGTRLAFRYGGALMDPLTSQLAFDFELHPERQMRVVRRRDAASSPDEVQEIFLRAVRLEEDPSARAQAVDLYQEVLRLEPNHAPACINLGTIHYGLRDFAMAETMYRRATLADPGYALAFFDLGNVLDELQQLDHAIEAYQRAVALVPAYADAHYNLALAYERKGERRRALRHWNTYVRLDPVGPWASHARSQAKKILSAEQLSIVSRNGSRLPTAV